MNDHIKVVREMYFFRRKEEKFLNGLLDNHNLGQIVKVPLLYKKGYGYTS